ncbi:hypothetical protein LJ707_12770 [Mucilaginibacter sp. UR6-1]|uniref:hypothetical protein n=1 Tax=Mucilaginibacter sp. UR6-1 TaxID=1435643 RepID=UPI001E50E721|nr:hypothetical protein [Mucilaginibacter sp. UR6-1]MCC8409802.1 hypothetical protein [Mucilaginibacter sp. UR6-1]
MIITTLGFQDKQEELDVLKNGNLVEAEITHLPGSCLGTKAKWYMKIKVRGQIITKQIPGGYCDDHHIGEKIKVKYLDGSDSVLFPHENLTFEFISLGALFLFGLYVFIWGIRGK